MQGSQEQMTQQLNGHAGWVFEAGNTAITGAFCKLLCVDNSVFTVLTNSHHSGDALVTSFPAGTVIPGKTTAFTLASGRVIAYRETGL